MKSDYIAENNEDYKSQEYWETRFLKEESYEWLVPLSEVAPQLLPLLKKDDKILMLGCGNSPFSGTLLPSFSHNIEIVLHLLCHVADLYDAGYENIVNIDYSSNVIERMKAANQSRVTMSWLVMDMMELNFPAENGLFDVNI